MVPLFHAVVIYNSIYFTFEDMAWHFYSDCFLVYFFAAVSSVSNEIQNFYVAISRLRPLAIIPKRGPGGYISPRFYW